MNVTELILSQGADSAPAILYGSAVVTYAQLRKDVAEVSRGLLASGHAPGDRIGILSENNPFFVSAYLGSIAAGLVAVPLPTEITEETLTRIMGDAAIRRIFVSKRLERRMQSWAEQGGVDLSVESGASGIGQGNVVPAPRGGTNPQAYHSNHQPPKGTNGQSEGRQLAALMFTSGSTGIPKGVMVSHRNIGCNTRDIISYMGLRPDDRVMVVLPFHYCFGLSLLHTHLMAGASLVLNNNFRLYPETVLQEMQQKECTGIAGVPSTYQILLRKSRFRQMPFPRLRWFQQAGGKLPNPCIAEIRESFPQVRYFLMYGQTEGTARLSYLPPERLSDKFGSVGKGLPSTRLEVLKADGLPVKPGSEEVGEIVARGDNIASGYWNDPSETAKFFKDGRLYTGDLARVDEDGFIFIVERERDMIKSGGNRVSAKEIEDVIAEMPEVVEVAVVGVPHELLGEAIKAFVVATPKAKVTPAEVAAHCRKRLPAYKMPEEVIFLKAMPHNSAGKVMKQELKKIGEAVPPREAQACSQPVARS